MAATAALKFRLLNGKVVEAVSLVAVHLEVFPVHIFRIRIAHEILEPRSRVEIADGMVVGARYDLDVVDIVSRMLLLKAVELIPGVPGEDVPVEHLVLRACTEGECDIGAILHRGVLQRLTSRNRTRTCQIISIIGCETLAAVCSLGDADEEESVRVNLAREHPETDEFLPRILLAFLPPAVV